MTTSVFLSYTHFDNSNDSSFVTKLAECISNEVRAQSGRDIPIYKDVDDIHFGQQWRPRLQELLDLSSIFIPVVTPSYLRSEVCRWEFEYFLQRENEMGWSESVLPIYYIECPEIERSDTAAHPIVDQLRARQWSDCRRLRRGRLKGAKADAVIQEIAKRVIVLSSIGSNTGEPESVSTMMISHIEKPEKTNEEIQIATAHLVDLCCEARTCADKCRLFVSAISTPIWDEIKLGAWFQQNRSRGLLTFTIQFFETIEQYNGLPRIRGKGYEIERWVRQRCMDDKLSNALRELSEFKLSGR